LSATTSHGPNVQLWASELVRSFEDDAVGKYRVVVDRAFLELETDRRILIHSPADQAEVGAAILVRLQGECPDYHRRLFLNDLAGYLLSERLPYSEERLADIIEYCAESLLETSIIHQAVREDSVACALVSLLKQVEYVADDGGAHGRLAAALARLSHGATTSRLHRSLRRVIATLVDRLSGDSGPTLGLAASPWRDKVLGDIGMLPVGPAGTSRRALELSINALRKSKPSHAFLEAARSLLAEDRGLAARVIGWIEAHVPNPGSPELNEGHHSRPHLDARRSRSRRPCAAHQQVLRAMLQEGTQHRRPIGEARQRGAPDARNARRHPRGR
jgi:hypothetical protein